MPDDGLFAFAEARGHGRTAIGRRLVLPGCQATVALARDRGGLGVGLIEIPENRGNGAAHIIDVETVKAGPVRQAPAAVMFAHPLDEIHHFAVAPHPGRETLERRVEAHALTSMSDIAVDCRRIRPIRLDRHDREPVFLDQAARDGCAGAVEFRRAVARLSEQHDPPPGKAIEKQPECRIVEIGQRLGRLCNQLGQRGRRSEPCPGLSPLLMPAVFADERHESDPAEVLLLECRGVDPRDLHQALLLRGPTGMTRWPPRSSCSFSACGISGPPAATSMASKGPASGQPAVPSPTRTSIFP